MHLFSKITSGHRFVFPGIFLVAICSILFFASKTDKPDDTPPKESEQEPTAVFTDKGPVEVPFDMPKIEDPSFPDRTCDITDYQAVGDGKTSNTESFRAAITDCAKKGGGRVLVPSGIWFTGPIHLESNIDLHLEEGAHILFSDTFSDYLPAVFTRFEGIELYNYSPFLSAKDCTNIAITGKGEIDGNGGAWLAWNEIYQSPDSDITIKKTTGDRLYKMAANGTPVEKRIFGTERDALQPTFMEFINCKHILVEGVEITNSPGWTLHPVYSSDIIIRDIYINTSKRNTDGIVVDSSRNVIIENSSLNTGDDAITIKSGRDQDGWRVGKPSENILIHDIRIEDGNSGIAIGSEMSGDIRNVLAYNIDIQVVDFGIRFKSMPGRGGIVEKIWVDNVFMRRANYGAIHMDLNYGTPIDGYKKDRLPVFRDIEIRNVECRRTKDAIYLDGLPGSPITGLTLGNVSILSSKGVTFNHVEGKILDDVTVTVRGKTTPITSLSK